MATATSTGSGNWSAAIWTGGSGSGGAPADGDAVIIAAGHSVLMDADLSGWTGLTTLTITSDAATPGMLYFKNGTNGYLKFRTGTNYGILGTDAAALGRLLANSDGVWGHTTALTVANKAVIATCSSDIKSALATQAELNKVPKSDGSTSWNATALAAIQSEAKDALDAYDPPTQTELTSAFTEINGATWDSDTDTLEAIRDQGDSAWITATGFGTSNFDPTSDKVYLGDGAHGGSAATVTLKSMDVENSEGDAVHLKSTAAGGMGLKLESTGAGNSHALSLVSTTGGAIVGVSGSHGINVTSSAGNGMVIVGATGDIVADITGDLSGSVGSVTGEVDADIKKVNGTTLTGNGTAGTPWGPA